VKDGANERLKVETNEQNELQRQELGSVAVNGSARCLVVRLKFTTFFKNSDTFRIVVKEI
jgi:hypothetical protein